MTEFETDIEVWLEDFLSSLMSLATMDLSIEELYLDDQENLVVQLSGQDSARAIGREGAVLEAIQHIVVSAAIHAGLTGRRIIVDVERYRERREQKVCDDAANLANEVLSTGRSLDFDPMSARERRLVHMTISGIEGVSTESVGEGDGRFVRVVPR